MAYICMFIAHLHMIYNHTAYICTFKKRFAYQTSSALLYFSHYCILMIFVLYDILILHTSYPKQITKIMAMNFVILYLILGQSIFNRSFSEKKLFTCINPNPLLWSPYPGLLPFLLFIQTVMYVFWKEIQNLKKSFDLQAKCRTSSTLSARNSHQNFFGDVVPGTIIFFF